MASKTERKTSFGGYYMNRIGPTVLGRFVPLFRKVIWSHEKFYWGYKKWRGGLKDANHDDFAYWVDGYPRSANTFMSKSLALLLPDLKARSHSHSPFLPIAATKRGIPGVLVIREPADAIVSYVVMTGHRFENALSFYEDFHRPLLKVADQIFVAHFSRITKSPNEVIAEFGEHFSMDLPPFEEGSSEAVFENIEKAYVAVAGSVNSTSVARPDAKRKERLTELRKELEGNKKLGKRLQGCELLYESLLRESANQEYKRVSDK